MKGYNPLFIILIAVLAGSVFASMVLGYKNSVIFYFVALIFVIIVAEGEKRYTAYLEAKDERVKKELELWNE